MLVHCTSSLADVKNLKHQNEILLQRCEENEQYGGRLCLSITDIPPQKMSLQKMLGIQ